MQKHTVLIVGGGFAGLRTARRLAADDRIAVTVLSDRPDFRYYPVTYHTATGGLKSQSSIPLPDILGHLPVNLERGTAAKLDRSAKAVTTADGRVFTYDSLVLALGSVPNYFGIDGMQEYSFNLQTMEDMQILQDHLHRQLEDNHRPDANYVIVGGGPTGIELAGSLPGYLKRLMRNHGIRRRALHIDLVEAAPRLLPRSRSKVSRKVARRLRELGVRVYTGTAVQGRTADELTINGKPLQSHTVIWTAGTANHPFFKTNGFTLTKRGKVTVDEHLRSDPDIFVLGDNADTKYSGMADTAMHDGGFAADIIRRKLDGAALPQYKPRRPASIIPVGPRWAAVEWGPLAFTGRAGWWMREKADWASFHKLEPWWQANRQWAAGFGAEEDCPTCATAEIR